LVPPGARVQRDLPEALVVQSLPRRVHVSPDATAPREALVAWSRRVTALLDAAERAGGVPDVAAITMSIGALLAEGGLAADPARATVEPVPIAAEAVLPWVEALHRRAARREREDAGWRSGRDLARRATRWIALAAGVLLDPVALSSLIEAPAAAPASE